MVDLRTLGAKVEAELYRRGAKLEQGQLRMTCVSPNHHGDRDKDARYNRNKQAWCCYVCGAKGGLLAGDMPLALALGIEGVGQFTDERRARWAAEAAEHHRAAAAEREIAAAKLREHWDALARAEASENAARAIEYLAAGGISAEAAEHFGMTGDVWKHRPALVIPWKSGGIVRGIQYRWLAGEGRYETHPGSVLKIYNADAVREPVDDTIIVVEGAKKCAAVWSTHVISVCAVRNKTGWTQTWGGSFDGFDRVVFALDPDATNEAREAARSVRRGFVATLPMKPDDMLLTTRGDPSVLMRYIDRAERVTP